MLHEFASVFIVTIYLLIVSSNCAIYSAHVSTGIIAGFQLPLNVYHVCAVDVFFGVSHAYSGVSPYSTISLWITSPSQSMNFIKYFLVISSYCAVYSAHVSTGTISGFHLINVYPVCAVWIVVE